MEPDGQICCDGHLRAEQGTAQKGTLKCVTERRARKVKGRKKNSVAWFGLFFPPFLDFSA